MAKYQYNAEIISKEIYLALVELVRMNYKMFLVEDVLVGCDLQLNGQKFTSMTLVICRRSQEYYRFCSYLVGQECVMKTDIHILYTFLRYGSNPSPSLLTYRRIPWDWNYQLNTYWYNRVRIWRWEFEQLFQIIQSRHSSFPNKVKSANADHKQRPANQMYIYYTSNMGTHTVYKIYALNVRADVCYFPLEIDNIWGNKICPTDEELGELKPTKYGINERVKKIKPWTKGYFKC